MEITPDSTGAEKQTVEQIVSSRAQIQSELAKVIVGQKQVIEQLLIALFAGGHCLITGAPGLAKTLLVKSIAQIFHLKFQRIQFTPDLMPATTQAAPLEAMQEHQVTAPGVRHEPTAPFFVLATQNPIEMEGTYPLP